MNHTESDHRYMNKSIYIFIIFRWSSEPSGDLHAVFTWERALEEVPVVLFLPDSRSLSGCSDCIRHVFWYVKLNRNNKINKNVTCLQEAIMLRQIRIAAVYLVVHLAYAVFNI